MRVLKTVLMVFAFVMAIGMTSCTNTETSAEDELYEQEAVDLSKGHRPGTRG